MFAEIALNLPLYSLFTYEIPSHLERDAVPGKRAVISFANRTMTGIIVKISEKSALSKHLPVRSILDTSPVIDRELMNFCMWISDYYIAPPGEVLFSGVPSRSGVSASEKFRLTDKKAQDDLLKGLRSRIYEEIVAVLRKSGRDPLSARQIERRTGLSNLGSYLQKLKLRGAVEEITETDRGQSAKFRKYISLSDRSCESDESLKEHKLRSDKYRTALRILGERGEMSIAELTGECGITGDQTEKLRMAGLVKISLRREMREHELEYDEARKEIVLNDHQLQALEEISSHIRPGGFKPYLLHGVTGSGKTEVYIKVASRCIDSGKTAIILVPEISLTPQLIHRFRIVFGKTVGTIHSKLSDGERFDTFERILSGEIKIVIGARSALFAPLKNIGLIVVDEEHDSSYKQESSPRYHGRDAAVYRASLNNAIVILGSATPSVESYHNARNGKYKLIRLPGRVSEGNLPDIRIINLNDRESFMDDEEKVDFLKSLERSRVRFLSKDLIFEIGRRLTLKESMIILQNRRGYHSYLECRSCGNVEMCIRCNIALAYHKSQGLVRCHFCGFSKQYSGLCSGCGSFSITPKGAGTERVEEELQKIFPAARIVRMDSDTMSSGKKFARVLKDFYDGKIDILTGTQIISKGLDFPDVTLVGVVNADIGLLNPDFRATEKTFQILTQVSGRSGRSNKKGEVLIQTNHAEYFVFEAVRNHDYSAFYEREIKMRKELFYPPFSRLAVIELRHEDNDIVFRNAKEVYESAVRLDGKKTLQIFPPVQPMFSKLKDKHRYQIMIKSPKDKDRGGAYLTAVLRRCREDFMKSRQKSVLMTIDVDAFNLL